MSRTAWITSLTVGIASIHFSIMGVFLASMVHPTTKAPTPPKPKQLVSCRDGATCALQCQNGITESCATLVSLHEMWLVNKTPEIAKLYQKLCDSGRARACDAMGDLYRDGLGVKENLQQAIVYYEKGCQGGEAWSCYSLGTHRAAHSQEMFNKARGLFSLACSVGDIVECHGLAMQYWLGNGVKADSSRAIGLFSKACSDGNPDACKSLGELYQTDQHNYPSAIALYEKACQSGDSLGCLDLGNIYFSGLGGTAQDKFHGAALYLQACDLGNPIGCDLMANLYQNGDGVPQNTANAISLYQKACIGKGEINCHNQALGKVGQLPPTPVPQVGPIPEAYPTPMTVVPRPAIQPIVLSQPAAPIYNHVCRIPARHNP